MSASNRPALTPTTVKLSRDRVHPVAALITGALQKHILREKCSYSEFFWSVFSRIWTEHGEMLLTLCIQSEYKKIWTRKTPSTDTFHAVISNVYG